MSSGMGLVRIRGIDLALSISSIGRVLQEDASARHRSGGRAAKPATSQDGLNQAPWLQDQTDGAIASTRGFRH
jgi:hypothetical protein